MIIMNRGQAVSTASATKSKRLSSCFLVGSRLSQRFRNFRKLIVLIEMRFPKGIVMAPSPDANATVAHANESLEPRRRCLDDRVAPKAVGVIVDGHDGLIDKL